MDMENMNKLEYLEQKVNSDIPKINKKADQNRARGVWVNIAAILFGASVTILLGLKIEPMENIFKNLALVFGVLVTITNAVDSLFSYRSLWIKQKVTLLQLYSLRNEIEFYKSGLGENTSVSGARVTRFFRTYQEIWNTASEEWLRLRSVQQQDDDNKEGI